MPHLAVDVGTGSGSLAIGLARHVPGIRVIATDISDQALAVARDNAQCHDVEGQIIFSSGSLLDPVSVCPDIIVANLPYLSDAMMDSLNADVRHEPRIALHGGDTGLELYSALLAQVAERDWPVPILIEIDPRQTRLLPDVVHRHLPFARTSMAKDLAGHERVALIQQAG